MKAGAFTPAIREFGEVGGGVAEERSMKAGAFTPAILTGPTPLATSLALAQ